MRSTEWPVAVRTLDLEAPLEPLDDVHAYPRVRLFVMDGGELVGSVDIWNAHRRVSVARLRDAVAEQLTRALLSRGLDRNVRHARGAPAPSAGEGRLDPAVTVSIVLPTCDRPDDLRRCLLSLRAQRSARPVEILVVDNRPAVGAARDVCREFPGVRVVEEPRPGLSYARNAGFAAATGDILVATDDDVVAPPEWIERLLAPFERPEVMAVTGQVLPRELETESQCRFEAYGGLGKGFERFEADGPWFRSRRAAVPTWRLGATANAAFRATALESPDVGLLDPALGAGSPTGCSEDTYLFYRLLKAGHTIVYEPRAYVWHRHRETMESLRRQIYAYSKGHVAYHLITLFRDRDVRALVRLFWSLPRTYMRRAVERLLGRSDYPLDLIALEMAGNLAGPLALWRARRRVGRLGPGASLGPDRAVRPRVSDPAAPLAAGDRNIQI